MDQFLCNMADYYYEIGLINIDEYWERIHVARWLYDANWENGDPRVAEWTAKDNCREEKEADVTNQADRGTLGGGSQSKDDDKLTFVYQGWVFTKADPDPYPSTPHGHLHSQNRTWPKLDPYRGFAFKAKHQEDVSLRMSRKDLKKLWDDMNFRVFCAEHIDWYRATFPYHDFRVRNPMHFPRYR
jgi:hypothetical protein